MTNIYAPFGNWIQIRRWFDHYTTNTHHLMNVFIKSYENECVFQMFCSCRVLVEGEYEGINKSFDSSVGLFQPRIVD